MSLLKRYPATAAGLAAGALLFLLSHLADIEVFEVGVELLSRLEDYEADEVVVWLSLTMVGLAVDLLRKRRAYRTQLLSQQQQLAVLKGTVSTAQDLVNNSMHGVLHYLEQMRQDGGSQEAFDEARVLIDQTVRGLNELQGLETAELQSWGDHMLKLRSGPAESARAEPES